MSTKPTYEELVQRLKELERDSIERERTEEKLRHDEHYLRSLLNSINEDILVIDRDYRITDVNKAFLITSGRKREDVIGRHCYEVSHNYNEPCEEHGEECVLRKVFETEEPCNAWHQHTHAQGWKTWVDIFVSPFKDEEGNVTHVIEAVREVTELVRAGVALQESEEKYRHLVESTHDWIWSIDIEGRFTFSNEAVVRLLGYTGRELLGSSSYQRMHPDDQERFQKLFEKSVALKRGWHNSVICWLHKNGSVRYFESSARAIKDDEGHLTGFAGIDRDITKLSRVAEALER